MIGIDFVHRAIPGTDFFLQMMSQITVGYFGNGN